MTVRAFAGRTADDVWCEARDAFRDITARSTPQDSRDGAAWELLHPMFSVAEPRQRWVLSREPALNPAFALAEVVWILRGERRADFLNFWNPGLPRFAGSGTEYHGAYGYRLRRHFGFDQLDRACDVLAAKPHSRQVVLQIWDAAIDMPLASGEPMASDIPCNVASLLKVRDGRLEWMQIMRSNDLFLGFPHNVVQFTTLQEVMSGWLDVRMGQYTHLSDSLHVYERDIAALVAGDRVHGPDSSDILSDTRRVSDESFRELYDRMLAMMTSGLDERQLSALCDAPSLGRPYQNILVVVAADAARRHGWHAMAAEIGKGCTNPALRLALQRWLTRTAALV